MSVTNTVLIETKQAENSETTQFTADTLTVIDRFSAYNGSGSTATLTVRLVPSGGTAGASNAMIAKALTAGETYTFPEVVGHYLATGDFISTLSSAATAIVIRASGRKRT